MKRFALALALLVAAGLSFTAFAREDKKHDHDHDHAHAELGKPAPDLTLIDQNGNTVKLSDFNDKVVVLEWFNDGCPFVVKFYKEGHMNKWAEAYAEKGVVWLAINSTHNSDNAHNKKVAEKWNINRPILNDQAGVAGDLYEATRTPHMFVINKGVLVYRGAIDDKPSADTNDIAGATNYVAKALDEVLAGTAVSTPETKAYGCTVKYKK
jgi:peroxiredoxin